MQRHWEGNVRGALAAALVLVEGADARDAGDNILRDMRLTRAHTPHAQAAANAPASCRTQ